MQSVALKISYKIKLCNQYKKNLITGSTLITSISSTALNNDPERKQRVLKRTPLGKLGLPEDVANMAYFLVSDQNTYITGAVIPVDGGTSIGF